ncbi:MAG: multicopper oxidase domain-containing protein [Gemmatimonadaceae bacterium]
MRVAVLLLVSPMLGAARPVPASRAPAVERIVVNDNREPAGVLRDGVLTLRLEARDGEWHPDGESKPGIVVRAFAEKGKRLTVPGPLVRVPEGTEIRAFVTNTFSHAPLVLHGMSPRGAHAANLTDTVQIAAGATRELRFVAGAPGTYYYRATIAAAPTDDASSRDAELTGAFIVDPRGAPRALDRIFVISLWTKSPPPLIAVRPTTDRLVRFTINGRSWPATEQLSYAMGDTARMRFINTSIAGHPMHLHGFYFDVNSRGDGSMDSVFAAGASPRRVVTERAAAGHTFTMSWVPERAGNWLLHCHDNFHVLRNKPFDGSLLVGEHLVHASNHAMEMMGGLVMGVTVRGQDRSAANTSERERRSLRLVAKVDSGGDTAEPSFSYQLQERSARPYPTPRLHGATLMLKRGEPVSITVVNELAEPTAVHWHGIELESYFDGVAGFSGNGRLISPVIAPRDSFVARFTPPRSGTFMFHPHADEVRQQQAGLSGALLVLDDPAAFDTVHDVPIVLTVPRDNASFAKVAINGTTTPAPLQLHAGERYRLRFLDLLIFRASMTVRLVRDSTRLAWRPIAKDGMDLPPDQARTVPAVQTMGMGETYDFELVPAATGDFRLTLTTLADIPLGSMLVQVR